MVFRRKGATATSEQASTRAKEIGAEVGAGVGHLRTAAVATAGAAREAVKPAMSNAKDALGPRVGAAREALAPRLEQARDAVSPRVEAARDSAVSTMKPAVDSVLVSLAPLVAAAVEAQKSSSKKVRKSAKKWEKSTRGSRKEARRRATEAALALKGERARRWPWVVGALAAGTAVGLAAALVTRRNREPEWEEYDLDTPVEPVAPAAAAPTPEADPLPPVGDTAVGAVATDVLSVPVAPAETVKEKAGRSRSTKAAVEDAVVEQADTNGRHA